MTRPPSHIPASPNIDLVDLVAAAGILFVAFAFVSIMADLISLWIEDLIDDAARWPGDQPDAAPDAAPDSGPDRRAP